MDRNHSASQVKQFVEDVKGHINIKQPHLNEIISETNLRRLQNVLQDIQHQADKALDDDSYYVYDMATPYSNYFNKGDMSEHAGPFDTPEEAEKVIADETAKQLSTSRFNDRGDYRPAFTFFISRGKLDV